MLFKGLIPLCIGLVIFVASAVVALLIFEFIYRTQLVDTFRAERQAYNSPAVLSASDQKTVLVMGDSFSAGNTSYVGWLSVLQSEYRAVNAAVPGTGILEGVAIA